MCELINVESYQKTFQKTFYCIYREITARYTIYCTCMLSTFHTLFSHPGSSCFLLQIQYKMYTSQKVFLFCLAVISLSQRYVSLFRLLLINIYIRRCNLSNMSRRVETDLVLTNSIQAQSFSKRNMMSLSTLNSSSCHLWHTQ